MPPSSAALAAAGSKPPTPAPISRHAASTAGPASHAAAPERTSAVPIAHRAAPAWSADPVQHAATPAMSSADPVAHGSTPAWAADPVQHAATPAMSNADPVAHQGAPAWRADPVQHAATPAMSSADPVAHQGTPAWGADPMQHAAAPTMSSAAPVAHGAPPASAADAQRRDAAPIDSRAKRPDAVEPVGQHHVSASSNVQFAMPDAQPPTAVAHAEGPLVTEPTAPLGLVAAWRGVSHALRVAAGLAGTHPAIDAWGKDAQLSSSLRPLADLMYERYWRVTVEGAALIPSGPCLLVSNHGGALPLDGPVLHLALRRERPDLPDARWLLEDQLFDAPFIGVLANRLGAVRASPENALALLAEGRPVLVFPEGFQALSKPVAERYQLRRFGRGGYVKIAARARVPIVPVAVVGSEETMPVLAKIPLGRLGLPHLPVTLPPLPVRWFVRFDAPIELTDVPAELDGAADFVDEINQQVTTRIDALLTELLARRASGTD